MQFSTMLKDGPPSAAQDKEAAGEDDDEDTPTSRLVAALLKHLIKGFNAKDKIVRYRVVQIVAELIFSLGELESVLNDWHTSIYD
jgi:condensin complex subunit 3